MISEINLLLLPYIFNILVLIPVGLPMPFGGEAANRLILKGKLPQGAEMRTISGSAWTVVMIGSVSRAVPPSLDVAGPVDPGHLQLTLAQRFRCTPLGSRSSHRGPLGHRRDVPLHHSDLSLGDPLGQGTRGMTAALARLGSPRVIEMRVISGSQRLPCE